MLQFALHVTYTFAFIGNLIIPIWAIFLTTVAGYLAFSDN